MLNEVKLLSHCLGLQKSDLCDFSWTKVFTRHKKSIFQLFSAEIELLKCMSTFSVFQSVEGEHHEKAVELLKAAQGTVKLVVRYTPKVLEEMESRFEKLRSAKRRQQNNYPQ